MSEYKEYTYEERRRYMAKKGLNENLLKFPFDEYGIEKWDWGFWLSKKFLLNRVKVKLWIRDASRYESDETKESCEYWNDYYLNKFDPDAFAVKVMNHIVRNNPAPQYNIIMPDVKFDIEIYNEFNWSHCKYSPSLDTLWLAGLGKRFIVKEGTFGNGLKYMRNLKTELFGMSEEERLAEIRRKERANLLFGDNYTDTSESTRIAAEMTEMYLERERIWNRERQRRYRERKKAEKLEAEREARSE